MKKQHGLFRSLGLATLLAASVVLTYAQADRKANETGGARSTDAGTGTSVEGEKRTLVLVNGRRHVFDGKEAQSILVWLNNNPMALMDGGPGNGGGCFKYELLPLDMSAVNSFANSCPFNLVVPKTPLEGPRAFKGKEFDGTVYDPFGPQPKAGTPPARGAANATIALFSMDTGRLEATTTTDSEGRYKFSGIPEGRKAIFVRDKRGNLIYADNVQVCGRGVNTDRKGCTETRIPRN